MGESAAVTPVEIARLAGVGRAAVSNWRRRHADFPRPISESDPSPSFRLADIRVWLQSQGKMGAHSLVELAWLALEAEPDVRSMASMVAAAGDYLRGDPLGGLSRDVVDALDQLKADGGGPEALERLCARYAEAFSRQLVLSPPELAELMVDLARIEGGTLFDPACGIGSLLSVAPNGVEALGQEADPGLAALARSRLNFDHGVTQIIAGDSLCDDAYERLQFSAIVCNPPFNQKSWGYEELQHDVRWVYGLPPKGESELAWVQHCLAHLAPGCRAVIVLPPGVASRRSGRSIRAAIVRRDMLRAVIALPPGAVSPAQLSMHLWVLGRGDGSVANRAWLVDTRGGASARIADVGWAEVHRRATSTDEDASIRRLVPTIELLDDNVDFTPARYLRSPSNVDKIRADRDRLHDLLSILDRSLPEFVGSSALETAETTIGELIKQGALNLLVQMKPMTINEGAGTPVLTATDVVRRQGPSGFVEDSGGTIPLQSGDVVVATVAARSCALVVDELVDAVLGPGLQLLRLDPTQLDPWFIAGVLRGGDARRVAASMSGSHRIDVRRVELPRLPLAQQVRLGTAFQRLAGYGGMLDEAAEIGQRLEMALIDGVVRGQLEPGGDER